MFDVPFEVPGLSSPPAIPFTLLYRVVVFEFSQKAEGEKINQAQDDGDLVATVGGARPDSAGVPDARGGRRPAHAHAVLQDRAAADEPDAGY